MTAMNRLFYFYSDRNLSAQLDERELGFDFMYLSIDKQKRGNCVTYIGKQ